MRMNINVKTGKSESRVVKKEFGEYEVWVKSPPVKAAANKESIGVLADYFNVKPHNLRIVKGLKSHLKIIDLTK